MAHTSQSRPDSGPGSKTKVLKTLYIIPCSLGSGQSAPAARALRENSLRICSKKIVLEYGTHRPGKTRFWPHLELDCRQESPQSCTMFPLRFISARPISGLQRDFEPDFDHLSVTFPVGTPLHPYGVPTVGPKSLRYACRRTYASFAWGLFKKIV